MNITVKKYENWPTVAEVVARQSWPGTFDTPCTAGCMACRRVLKTFFIIASSFTFSI